MNPRSRAKAGDADVKIREREPNDFTQEYLGIGLLFTSVLSSGGGRKRLSNSHEPLQGNSSKNKPNSTTLGLCALVAFLGPFSSNAVIL
jgi:hypothetical protein